MEPLKRRAEDRDRAIYAGILELILCDTETEFLEVCERCPDLKTERARQIILSMTCDIPPGFVRDEWETRARFICGMIESQATNLA